MRSTEEKGIENTFRECRQKTVEIRKDTEMWKRRGNSLCAASWKPQEEGIKKKLTEAFTRNIWLCRENNTQKEFKAGEEAVTADITKVDRNC